MLSKLRKASVVEGIGNEEATLPSSSKLPTVRDVLRTFFYHMQQHHDVRRGARTAARLVFEVWNTTKVPCIQEIRAIEKIESLYKEYRGQFKNTPKNPNLAPQFAEKLDTLFDISKKDAVSQLDINIPKSKSPAEKRGWEEEKLFLLDQQGPRLGVIGGIDREMRRKDLERQEAEKRKIGRLLEEDVRRKKEEERRRASGENVELEGGESDTCPDPDDSPVKPKRGRNNVLTLEIVEVLDYSKISNTQATKLIAAIAGASGTSVKETNLNRTTLYRKREQHRAASANSPVKTSSCVLLVNAM